MTRPPPPTAATREFYDSEYHFAADAARPDEPRLWRALRLLEPLEGRVLLDLGCGAGWAARLAVQRGRAGSVIGLDFSRTALDLARRHSPEVLWLQADGTALPVADGSIDRLFCNGSLEHFPDVRLGLREIRRILHADRGRAVLIVPNFHVRTEQPMEFRAGYLTWRRLLKEAGLRIEKVGRDWGPPLRGAPDLKRLLMRLAGKLLSAVPMMQYQFILAVRPA
jgi:ubiquinone/menaquinone biosynthesis C-methylase UbiE